MTPDEKDAVFYPYQTKAADVLRDAGLEHAWKFWVDEHRLNVPMSYEKRKLIDLVGYGASYGYYSTGHLYFIRSLLQKIVEN